MPVAQSGARSAGCVFFAAVLLSLAPLGARAQVSEFKLPQKDAKLLERLVKEFLFDPRGASRVRVATDEISIYTNVLEEYRDGWLVAGNDGAAAKIVFLEGDSIPVPDEKRLTPLDYVAECRKLYAADTPPEEDEDAAQRRARRALLGGIEPMLVDAAWLYRLGEFRLAAHALAQARARAEGKEDEELVAALRRELAWAAHAWLVHAFNTRADEQALAHGRHLLRTFPQEVKQSPKLASAEAIVADLERRKRAGKLGKAPSEDLPEEFAGWNDQRKLAYLIDALDESAWKRHHQQGLSLDQTAQALVELGDAAVPALLDVIENDDRLTRAVILWRRSVRSREVVSVRELALEITLAILRVEFLDPHAADGGPRYVRDGDVDAKEAVPHLRAYWKRYGSLSFDRRMMRVLTDPKANFEAMREAARNLGELAKQDATEDSNPVIDGIGDPTAAEAMLAAMDRELAAGEPEERDAFRVLWRGREEYYLVPLVALGDRRITAELARRCRKTKDARLRGPLSLAAQRLGDATPIRELAADVALGKITLPANDAPGAAADEQPGSVALAALIDALGRAKTPEADRALYRLADGNHPLHSLVVERVLTANDTIKGDEPWLSHPFCISILRQVLDDMRPTGAKLRIDGDSLNRSTDSGLFHSGPLPETLRDPAKRKQEMAERRCDLAGNCLCELLVTAPAFHSLRTDADEQRARLKESLDKAAWGYRRLTSHERGLFFLDRDARFLPDIRSLGRAATAEDVDRGAAVFHLSGKGRPAELKLPAFASPKGVKRAASPWPVRVLIVQAELDEDDVAHYGILELGGVRHVTGDRLVDVHPLSGD